MVFGTRPIFWTLFFGCSTIGGILASNPENDTFYDVAKEAGKDVGKQMSSNLKEATRATSNAVSKIMGAANSGLNFGLNEAADNFGRAENFVSQKLPEHTKKVKDSAGDLGNAALNHKTNQVQRVAALGSAAVKTLDDVSQTASEEANKYVESKGALISTAIQAAGKVGVEANEMQGRVITQAGDVAMNPGAYAAAGVERVRAFNLPSVIGQIAPFGGW